MMELNSREIAILLWGGGLLLWASWKSKDLRKSLGGVLRAVSHHKIPIPCAIAGAYAAACVILLWKFGFWESANLKTTLLWLLTFAFVTMGEIVQGVRDLGLHDVADKPTVNRMIRDLRNLKQRESKPPAMPWSLGWSPYQAAAFLWAHDLATKDYHRSFGDWLAESPMKDIGGGLFHDHLTYRIFGNEEAATRLKLVLNANLPGTPDQSDAAFQLTALALTT